MMLSYYDTFVDGTLIYDDFQIDGKKNEEVLTCPPAIKYYDSDNAKDFYELNKNGTLLGQLFDFLDSYPHFANIHNGDFGLTDLDIYRIFKDFILVGSAGRLQVKELEFHNLESINKKIREGYPVLVTASKSKFGFFGHCFIAYGIYNNFTICNMGWGDDMTSAYPFDEYKYITDAMYVEIKEDYHNCSKKFEDGICYCRYTRPHKYEIKPYDNLCHKKECQCGLIEYERHTFVERIDYYYCIYCHTLVKNNGPIIAYRRKDYE